MFNVKWAEKPEIAVGTISDLDKLLDQIQGENASSPVLVVVESQSSGDSLAIGLGRDESVLNFVSGSGNPPYWSSVGEHEEDGAVDFNFMGEVSEIPLRHLIPLESARQAVRNFVQTGKLSTKVEWEED